jgi:hypothetical protein
MNMIIIDEEDRILYGHQLLKRITSTDKSMEVELTRGISAECYIAYVHGRFPDSKEVKALWNGNEVNCDRLEAVSDSIELTPDDVKNMQALEAKTEEE